MSTIQLWIPTLLQQLEEIPLSNGVTSRVLLPKVIQLEMKAGRTLPDEILMPVQMLKKCCVFWNQKLEKNLRLSRENLETITEALPESILLTSFSPEVMNLVLRQLDILLSELLNAEMDSSDFPSTATTSTSYTTVATADAPAAVASGKYSARSGILSEMKDSYEIAQTSKQQIGSEFSSITFLQNGGSKAFQIMGYPSDYILTLNLYTTENLYEDGRKNFDKNKLFGVSQMPIQDNSEISVALEKLMELLKKDFMERNPQPKDSMEKSRKESRYGTPYENKSSNYYKPGTQHRFKPYVPWKYLNRRQS